MKRDAQDLSGVTSGERPFEDRALTATASPRARGLLHHRWMFPLLLGLAACASVLGLRRDSGNTPFPHRAHVLAGVSCVRCHRDIEKPRPLLAPPAPAAPAAPAASAAVAEPAAAASAAPTTPAPTAAPAGPFADDRGGLHAPDDASCVSAGCHVKPHDPRACSGCHGDAVGRAVAQDAKQHLVFSHARHAGKSLGNCMHCHSKVAEDDGAPLRPAMATCFRCHDHQADRDGRNCGACHVDLQEEGSLPESHLAHDVDFLRQHGARAASSAEACASCHRERFCASCHGATVPLLPARASFDDPWRASAHRAGFASRHALEARATPGTCTTCHAPSRCQSCHLERGVADLSTEPTARQRSPHPPGWVGVAQNQHGSAARRDPASCASCHGGAGEALCVSCHRVGGVGGNPHPAGYSSRQPKSALPCRLCHPAGS